MLPWPFATATSCGRPRFPDRRGIVLLSCGRPACSRPKNELCNLHARHLCLDVYSLCQLPDRNGRDRGTRSGPVAQSTAVRVHAEADGRPTTQPIEWTRVATAHLARDSRSPHPGRQPGFRHGRLRKSGNPRGSLGHSTGKRASNRTCRGERMQRPQHAVPGQDSHARGFPQSPDVAKSTAAFGKMGHRSAGKRPLRFIRLRDVSRGLFLTGAVAQPARTAEGTVRGGRPTFLEAQ